MDEKGIRDPRTATASLYELVMFVGTIVFIFHLEKREKETRMGVYVVMIPIPVMNMDVFEPLSLAIVVSTPT